MCVSTDGALPKEPKGDVSRQIAGGTNIHTYINPNALYTANHNCAAVPSPCLFLFLVCGVSVRGVCILLIVEIRASHTHDYETINISLFPVTKTVIVTIISHYHICLTHLPSSSPHFLLTSCLPFCHQKLCSPCRD